MSLILGIIAVYFIFRYVRLRRELTYVTNQLIAKENVTIKMKTLDQQVETLAIKINELYEEKQQVIVTQQKSELQLKQSVANISHDLRTPLTSIRGYLQLLEDPSLTKDEQFKYKEIVQKRLLTLQSLIEQFYELSLIQSKDYQYKLERLNLHTMLCDCLATYYSDFELRNIEPHLSLETTNAVVLADTKAVHRVFSNVILNMLKHGGQYFEMSISETKTHYVTSFINDAPYLSQDDVAQLFDRTYTKDEARSLQSTGLGLTITKALVEGMHHQIKASLLNDNLVISIYWRK